MQISSSVRSCATNSLRVGMSTPYTLGYRTGGEALARYTCAVEGELVGEFEPWSEGWGRGCGGAT